MKIKTVSSDLVCSECGFVFTIARPLSEKRETYHIKDIYCPDCSRITKFIELGQVDIVKKKLEFKKNNLNPFETSLYKILSMRDKENERKRISR